MANARQLMAARSAWSGGAKLPYDYALKYVIFEPGGYSYFTTGKYMRKERTRFVFDAIFVGYTGRNVNETYILGSRRSSSDGVYATIARGSTGRVPRINFRSGTGLMQASIGNGSTDDELLNEVVINSEDGIFVDGNEVYDGRIDIATAGMSICSYGFFGGDVNARVGVGRARYFAGDELIVDIIPCVKDGVISAYDTVSETFLQKQGTGTMTAGPKI